jgi:FMN phosphatase YigB (HAD superfamily)
MTNRRGNSSGIRAVLFDLDGTLYVQAPIRVLMALEMLALPVTNRSEWSARQIWRTDHSDRFVTGNANISSDIKTRIGA